MSLFAERTSHVSKPLISTINEATLLGFLIGLVPVIIATLIVGFLGSGTITLDGLIEAQKTRYALWVVDILPFAFALLGRYVSTMMASQAGAISSHQTDALRAQTAALETRALHHATHDTLTDLPNRVLLADRLQHAISVAQRDSKRLAVLCLDLDRFKEINDTLGHDNGNLILKQVASRLEATIESPNTIARIGSDEFGILLYDPPSPDVITKFSRRLHKALELPFALDRFNFEVEASIGITLFPDHGNDADMLLQRAELAMNAAKQAHDGFSLYSQEQDRFDPRRLALMSELRRAIEHDELLLHYQPKVNLHTGQVNEVEALVRWNQPGHGFISPEDFIPMAERTRLVKPLTHWVLKRAIRQCAVWRQSGLEIGIAVNISARDLHDPHLPDVIAGLLASSEVNPEWLVLEITEGSIMVDQRRALEVLTRLTSMGLRISIDDFGTGYSSLAYISKLPISEIKIDRSFVIGMVKNENDAVIVHAIIQLGHNLGLKVAAEGVESQEAWTLLEKQGCDSVQGYYLSKPMNSVQIIHWFNESPWALGKEAQRNVAGQAE
ncbi:MAG: EAL domain-containing protein [Gammaproteobacteria bacterium]|nr:EAL domain-containing protein [Gammaproteobacteria bacterium]MCI0590416.1 EAL domain-containing protein [Gammaproteobacteria bacterium]